MAVIIGLLLFFEERSLPIIDRSEYRALYHEGYSLYLVGEHQDSNELLSKGAEVSSDPVFHVIMGRNYEAIGDFMSAEREYLTAYYMVPCRLYPLVRLMRLKQRDGDLASVEELCRKIISMPVTDSHRTMQSLHDEAKTVLDSLISKETSNIWNCMEEKE